MRLMQLIWFMIGVVACLMGCAVLVLITFKRRQPAGPRLLKVVGRKYAQRGHTELVILGSPTDPDDRYHLYPLSRVESAYVLRRPDHNPKGYVIEMELEALKQDGVQKVEIHLEQEAD